MAHREHITEYEGFEVGDEVRITEEVDGGVICEGEEGFIDGITRYSGSQHDRTAIYVLIDGMDSPWEVPLSALEALPDPAEE